MSSKENNHNNLTNLMKGIINESLPDKPLDKEAFLKNNFINKKYIDYVTCTATYHTCFGGKRAGKSAANAGKIIWIDQFVEPDKPGYIFYASPTTEQSKRLSLKRLLEVRKRYKFQWKIQVAKNMIITQNQNVIQFIGLKDLKSVYQIQGLPVKACIVDEAQLINNDVLKTFIQDIVAMGMADFYGNAFCVLTGNPSPIHSGYCWDFKNNPLFKHFRINFLDNPHYSMDYKKKFLADEIANRGETLDNLSNGSKRLLYGQEIEDVDKMVLRFDEGDFFESVPEKHKMYCFSGTDLGFDDKTAIAVMYYDFENDLIYIDEEFQSTQMTLTPLAEKLNDILGRHDTRGRNIIDTQGGGKQTAATLATDYRIPIIPAKKADKMHYISLLRGYNKLHKIKVRRDSFLLNDSKHLIFNQHFTSLDDNYFHSDIFHAVLYAFSFIYLKFLEKKKAKAIPTRMQDLIDKIKRQKFKHEKKVDKKDYFQSSDDIDSL